MTLVQKSEDISLQRKKLVLSAALGILHNLCKVKDNVKYFLDSEVNALKWLDVYKSSPDEHRRISSLLILSYIIDPNTQSNLVEDTEGVLDLLMVKLNERINGKSNEFSTHELVEGLGKLAVNPVNRSKIIDKSLGNIETVLLVGTEKEKMFANIALKNLGFVPKELSEDSADGSKEPCESKTETDQVTAAVDFTRNLICVLGEMEDFTSGECSEIINAIYNGACKDLTREEREVLVKQLMENNLAGILMNVVSKLSSHGQALYENGPLFTTFYLALNLIWNNSDASLLFSNAMATVGAVKFLFGVCEKYYLDRRDQILEVQANLAKANITSAAEHIILAKSVNEPNTQESKESIATSVNEPNTQESKESIAMSVNEPNTQESKESIVMSVNGNNAQESKESIAKSVSEGNRQESKESIATSVDEVNTQESKESIVMSVSEGNTQESKDSPNEDIMEKEPSVGDNDDYYFKMAQTSDVTEISNQGRTVRSLQTPSLDKAVVVTNKPLQTNVLFEIQVDKFIETSFHGSTEFGVTSHSTIPDDVKYTGEGNVGKGTGFWILKSHHLIKNFIVIGGGYKLDLSMVKLGDCIGVARLSDATLHYYMNGEDMGVAFTGVPENIYMILSIDGRWERVELLGHHGNRRHVTRSEEEDEVKRIQEKFEVTTLTWDKLTGSKLKFPYGVDFVDEQKDPEAYKVLQKATKDNLGGEKMLEAYQSIQSAMKRLQAINEFASTKSYITERDTEDFIVCIKALSEPTDVISSTLVRQLNMFVSTMNMFITTHLRFDLDRRKTDIEEKGREMTGRFADIFRLAVKPCFDNLQNLSEYVWAGSTSEGFAFVDEHKDEVYINDEMDLMVPIATVAEHQDGGDVQSTYNAVSELTAVDTKLKNCTPLMWVDKHQHPGYVRICVSNHGIHHLSENFLKDICLKTEEDGEQIYHVSRAKLLRSQEDYVCQRFPSVQQELLEKSEEVPFLGKLRLVQEGPAQTLCIQFSIGEDSSGGRFLYEQMVDVTLALKCREWPSLAKSWITRERKWPSKELVTKIVRDGCHIVPKAYPGQGGDMDLDWRLSFSLAERTLALSINEHQRACYIVLKAFWRRFFKEPKVVSSYHLKTTFFWRCEAVPMDEWSPETYGRRFLEMMDDLIIFLDNRKLPNFFIQTNNMLSHVAEDDIAKILNKLIEIRKHVSLYFNQFTMYLMNHFLYSKQESVKQ